MMADQAWEAWAVSLYYGAGVVGILLLDSRRRSPPIRSGRSVPTGRIASPRALW